jgi:HlyD family secretion protein
MNATPTDPGADIRAHIGPGRSKRKLRRRLLIWGGGVSLVGVISWAILARGHPIHYLTQPVIRGPMAITVTATGTLAPRDKVEVGAEVSGKLDAINVDFNDPVRKGEVLAQINTDQLQAQLAQSEALLMQNRATVEQDLETYRRYRALLKDQAISPQSMDQAKADLDRARASVQLAKAQADYDRTLIGKATIISPINGIVLNRKVSVGQTVTAGFQTPILFTLASDLREMELDVDIDEADVGEVRAGDKATFTVDAYPNRVFHATLISVHNAAETVQNVVSYKGVLRVNNAQLLLRPGMTATATILADTIPNALQLPNAALRFIAPKAIRAKAPPPPSDPGEGQVWTIAGKTLKAHDLKLGATDGQDTQIIRGNLPVGTKVVTAIKTSTAKH